MDFKKEILSAHSKAQAEKLVNYIGNDATRFNQLYAVFLDGPYQVTQRASWPLSNCIIQHPSFIKPHFATLLKTLQRTDIHDAVRRNVMKLLQFIDIPKRYYGIVADHAFRLMDKKQPIAVRVFSMTVLARIAKQEPELKRELRLIIEDQLPLASPGYKARARKVLKDLDKQ